MNKRALGAFLRSRREALRPADVGLPLDGRRRTPGLRRGEVAELAGMSSASYMRLEQGQGAPPSPEKLAALARVLRLDRDEFNELKELAGMPEPRTSGSYLEPGLIFLLDSLGDVPAWVQDEATTVVAYNSACAGLFGELPEPEDPRSSTCWQWFVEPRLRAMVRAGDHHAISLSLVTELRAAAAWSPDPGGRVAKLVEGLHELSPTFAQLWDDKAVSAFEPIRLTVDHPEMGALVMVTEVMHFWTGHVVKFLRPHLSTPARRAKGTRAGTGSGERHSSLP